MLIQKVPTFQHLLVGFLIRMTIFHIYNLIYTILSQILSVTVTFLISPTYRCCVNFFFSVTLKEFQKQSIDASNNYFQSLQKYSPEQGLARTNHHLFNKGFTSYNSSSWRVPIHRFTSHGKYHLKDSHSRKIFSSGCTRKSLYCSLFEEWF